MFDEFTMKLVLLFIGSVCSDQVITVDLGQDVSFSCLFDNASLLEQVSRSI